MGAAVLPPGQSLKHPSGASRSCNIVLLVFLCIFWILWLAGIAATQDACKETSRSDFTAGELRGRTGLIKNLIAASSNDDCGMELSIEWWVLFYELLLICLMASLATAKEFGFRFEQTIITMTAINTGLMVVMAPRSVTEAHRFFFVIEKFPVARELTAAGNVGMIILNYIFIIMYTDKTNQLRPVMSPGLPTTMPPPPSYNSWEYGASDGPALPQSSISNPYYDRHYSKESEVAMAPVPMSNSRI